MEKILKQDAKNEGMTRFFTGVSCKHGHICERFTTNGACCECVRIRKKSYAERNPDKIKALRARGYIKNKDKYKTSCKKYAENNKQEIKKYQAEYYKNNREYILSNVKERSKKNIDQLKKYKKHYYHNNIGAIKSKAKEYRKTEKGKLQKRISSNKRMALKKSTTDGSVTAKAISYMMYEQKGLCVICEKIIYEKYHIDHIKPLAKGGKHIIGNIQLLCPFCNISKSDKYEE